MRLMMTKMVEVKVEIRMTIKRANIVRGGKRGWTIYTP